MQAAGAWDEYWRRTHEAAAHQGGGPQEAVLARFWTSFFEDVYARVATPRVLDFACGNGAVTRFAVDVASAQNAASSDAPFIVGVDRSHAALSDLRKRFPAVHAVIADARRTPFPDERFDVVVSQFGIEYAGVEAIDEAARLIARGGVLAAILHLKDGAIYRECSANLRAIETLRSSGFFAETKQAFAAAFAAARGRAAAADLQRAQGRLAAAAKDVAAILRDRGPQVAGGAISRLYADVNEMYRRAAAYEPKEIGAWIDNMERETQAYADRMSAMRSAAVDEPLFREILQRLRAQRFAARIQQELLMGRDRQEPGAWLLVAERSKELL